MADDEPERLWYNPNSPKAPPRQAQPGELLFEFHVAATNTFYRVELRDHGAYGVEAQFLDAIEVRVARTFISGSIRHARRARWRSRGAEEERKAVEMGND